ncbi:hypothetical protein HOBO_20 [Bacillus phage Hobo]|uniref:Uncharacterized protein n=2 Tax=Caeruleovirus BM15 TaxID=1985178 RepID=A0A0S2MU67_9CAUD|nr:hypothetical protein FD732_gp020 [Bacillus phage BM15]ALO79441.1 hypothetical protein BM10_20 [Bacillus phage BM15]AXQ66801.1 hypothetical protein HOBO_20 [Bacillus phage Hobo]
MSKTYFVAVPAVAKVIVEVNGATSEQDAIEKALAADVNLDVNCEDTTVWIDEWDMHENVTTGNVYHGVINEARVDSVEEDEDEEPTPHLGNELGIIKGFL